MHENSSSAAYAEDAIFPDRTPLPLTAGAIEVLLGEILVEAVASALGKRSPLSQMEALHHCEQRLPQVFSSAQTRGEAVATMDAAMERGLEDYLDDEAPLFPPRPRWVQQNADELLLTFLSVLKDKDILVPGATAYIEASMMRRPKLQIHQHVDEKGRQKAHTDWFRDPDTRTRYQLRLERKGGSIVLSRKNWGEEEFKHVSTHRLHELPYLQALLNWLSSTYHP